MSKWRDVADSAGVELSSSTPAWVSENVEHWSAPPEWESIAEVATPRRSGGSVLVTLLCLLAMIGSLCGGYYLYTKGQEVSVEQTMPLPDKVFTLDSHEVHVETPEGMTEDTDIKIHNADTGGALRGWKTWRAATPVTHMTIRQMKPGSVLIPALGIYSEARASDTFKESKYRGFYSLDIPDNPHRAVWYSDGGALTGTRTAYKEGTTLVAGHVSWGRSVRGAFYDLHKSKPGMVVYTKGYDNSIQTWAMSSLWFADHKKFPGRYFTNKGVRQLVLVTCGGRLNRRGYYRQNVFAVAIPIASPMNKEPAPPAGWQPPVITPESPDATPENSTGATQ